MQISVQLYSVREALARDFPGTMQRLADLGLTIAEPFHLVEHQHELAQAAQRTGITYPSAHQSFLGDVDFAPMLRAAGDLGVTHLIDPFWNPEDWKRADKVRSLARRMNERAEQAADAGITVGYHNHHFELASQLEGRSALELFAGELDERVVLEVDTYWAVVGGADITALLGALGDRVRLVHLKDGDLAEDPAGQLPLGEGRMPLEQTLSAARAAAYGVIEFDAYAGDIFEGIAASRAHLRQLQQRPEPAGI
ncbi:sugar phosphate isomerase/epimerase [Brachybacterium endophyticum]|uniref:Sugar phosphate isomerase/epimerase n=1 Tax=Brachybacterium endophyticum TaxID=2182385 RepID=A0A2U2RMX6_9MICO|nr:sugar phosphate isomerase/epimerase [Brachybacterium endophyticum]PWH07223.1 sugar phosphate isomerase/epimerase [Brachybacterium endophyticum]